MHCRQFSVRICSNEKVIFSLIAIIFIFEKGSSDYFILFIFRHLCSGIKERIKLNWIRGDLKQSEAYLHDGYKNMQTCYYFRSFVRSFVCLFIFVVRSYKSGMVSVYFHPQVSGLSCGTPNHLVSKQFGTSTQC